MTAIDATGLFALEEIARQLHATGRTLILCGAREQPARMIHQGEFEEVVGRENICANVSGSTAAGGSGVRKNRCQSRGRREMRHNQCRRERPSTWLRAGLLAPGDVGSARARTPLPSLFGKLIGSIRQLRWLRSRPAAWRESVPVTPACQRARGPFPRAALPE